MKTEIETLCLSYLIDTKIKIMENFRNYSHLPLIKMQRALESGLRELLFKPFD